MWLCDSEGELEVNGNRIIKNKVTSLSLTDWRGTEYDRARERGHIQDRVGINWN